MQLKSLLCLILVLSFSFNTYANLGPVTTEMQLIDPYTESSVLIYEGSKRNYRTGVFVPSGEHMQVEFVEQKVVLKKCDGKGNCRPERVLKIADINRVIENFNNEQKYDELVVYTAVGIFFLSLVACTKISACNDLNKWIPLFAAGGLSAGYGYGMHYLFLPTLGYEGDIREVKRRLTDDEHIYQIIKVGGLNEIRVSFSRMAMAIKNLDND